MSRSISILVFLVIAIIAKAESGNKAHDDGLPSADQLPSAKALDLDLLDVDPSTIPDLGNDVISEQARLLSTAPPKDNKYSENSFPAPPPVPALPGALIRPPPQYSGVIRTFTDAFNNVVIQGACVRVKVVIDPNERVVISGAIPQQFNNIFTWVVANTHTLYVTAQGLTPAQLGAISVTVYVKDTNPSNPTVSVTAQTNGIVTLVDATAAMAAPYQLYLYLYSASQILQVNAKVTKINTFAYASASMYFTGSAVVHHITGHVCWISAQSLKTKYTQLSIWDSCVVYCWATIRIDGMMGGGSRLYYRVAQGDAPPTVAVVVNGGGTNIVQQI